MEHLKVSLFKQYPNLDPSKASYEIEAIRTVNKNSETGAYSCASVFKVYNRKTQEMIKEIRLNYTIELTDDKKSFYVTFDLQ